MKLHKIEIARRQIEVAADLYFGGGDYLAIITLAGAAEEILGALLRRQSKPAMIDQLVGLDKRLTGGRDFSIVNAEVNGARNALKHANNELEDEIVVEPDQALAMLARAVANFVSLQEQASPAMVRVFDRLVELHQSDGR